ncbi:tail protein [Bacillus phage vB_Bacillus_1020A]|jgi:hypothetical protein|nr:hypothetical protein [Robertmurraya sp. DFI.2.37]MDF1510828.1 hypothetical protein [Robertmurraya sp. DFI.2.37]QIW89310.1 tail protein [Bacillus phage vB_Bacillus_1020A]
MEPIHIFDENFVLTVVGNSMILHTKDIIHIKANCIELKSERSE